MDLLADLKKRTEFWKQVKKSYLQYTSIDNKTEKDWDNLTEKEQHIFRIVFLYVVKQMGFIPDFNLCGQDGYLVADLIDECLEHLADRPHLINQL